jgi:hypothetical protein
MMQVPVPQQRLSSCMGVSPTNLIQVEDRVLKSYLRWADSAARAQR